MANVKGALRLRHLFIGLWLAACGGSLGQRTVGGESHFLRQCSDDCGAGLECVSGVCTRGCLIGRDECTDLDASAECTDASIEPGAVAVCDVSCSNEAGCEMLGAGFACQGGFCRGPVLPGQKPPSGPGTGGSGSGGVGATAGAGTGAVSIGGQPASGGFYEVPECSGLDREGDLERLAGGTPCPDGMACVLDYETSGRIPPGICVDESAVGACATPDQCPPGFDCTPAGDCSPKQAVCAVPDLICEIAPPPTCSYGYTRSFDLNCYGPCVPVTRCGCASNQDCPDGTVCDPELGHCQQPLPWQPPNECALRFEVGDCDGAFPVYAFVDGACRPQSYGGCGGNANRFRSLEECLAVCEGSPIPNPCPAARIERILCIDCGPADECAEWATVCAESCDIDDDCPADNVCVDGACSVTVCG